MKLVSSLALAAALALGGLAAAPASAAQGNAQAAPRKYNISKEAAKPLEDLRATVAAKNTAEFAQRLAAAEAVAKSNDEKYLIAKFRFQHARDINDAAAQLAAMEAILASGAAPADEVAQTQRNIAVIATQSKDYARADRAFAAMIAANPNDVDSVINLAASKLDQNREAEALPLLQRAIALRKAAGQTPELVLYQKGLQIAQRQNNRTLAQELGREALRLYPTKQSLQNAISAYSNGGNLSDEEWVDLLRLMYASGLMTNSNQYIQLANLLERTYPGEAKAVLDAATRAGLAGSGGAAALARVNGRVSEDRAALPTVETKARGAANGALALNLATAYFGYGDYAKAVDLYRVALEKGGVDANVVNTRLGIALAMAGRRAEAETALKAVTGRRADLAALWLAWVAQRG
ncbi:MAG TPA: tetratricopeptide repeat protein [Allosphingosinicella sp.]|jgi:tetratricopeptide (TPR) repeat protein